MVLTGSQQAAAAVVGMSLVLARHAAVFRGERGPEVFTGTEVADVLQELANRFGKVALEVANLDVDEEVAGVAGALGVEWNP